MNVMKIRIRFGKEGCMKFVGHLDVMRFFQKALLRAGIDIAYSEGFSPHQKMSFASPLGVGLTSVGEYMDISIRDISVNEKCERLTSGRAVELLNEQMVEGMKVYSYRRLPDNEKKAMSMVAAADYEVFFKDGMSAKESAEILEKLDEFYNRDNIFILKKTKEMEREKTVDIKPLIYSIKPVDFVEKPGIFMRVATGSVQNLKPEQVIEAFASYLGIPVFPVDICRLDLYMNGESGELVSLDAIGGDII